MSGLLQTEFEFTLPNGYVEDGDRHRDGVMRLATAADEIKPATDPRVQSNPGYLTVILLSRVVTELGTLDEVTPHVIENLFVSDLAFLQDLYEEVNGDGSREIDVVCPSCGEEFATRIELDAHRGSGTRESTNADLDAGVEAGNG